MTSEGSAYARFRRALDRRDLFAAATHAKELPFVGLAEAFELALLILEREPPRFDRAALRLHARVCAEARLDLDTGLAALSLLAAMRGPHAREAAGGLADLLTGNRALLPVAEVLGRWLGAADG